MHPIRIGCSGWNYADWRGRVYPKGCPTNRWLEHYATIFDTVEVNSTFYRLARRDAVARWVEQVPEGFIFAVKGSRYLTHMKRLTDMPPGVAKFYERIEPLVQSPHMGPVLWQLPGNFQRDDERLASAIDALPEGCRTVFLLHDVEGYTHEEIGAALEITAGTSKAQLSRARAKLRESLADFAGEWVHD